MIKITTLEFRIHAKFGIRNNTGHKSDKILSTNNNPMLFFGRKKNSYRALMDAARPRRFNTPSFIGLTFERDLIARFPNGLETEFQDFRVALRQN